MIPTPAPALPATQASKTALLPLRRQRNYLIWWIADSAALLGGGIYAFVLPLLFLMITNSPAQAGILASLGLIARASLTLAGGSKVDRTDRARMLLIGCLCGALFTACLALASFTGSLSAAILCVAHILMELRGGYFGSTTNASLKDLVHPKQLGKAMAANQGRDSVLMLGSAPLGGLLLGFSAGFALLLISGLQLLGAWTGYALRKPLRAAEESTRQRRQDADSDSSLVAHGIVAGMKWCFAHPQLRALLILITVINIGASGMMSTLTFGLQQRGEIPWVIGLVSTFMGLGMLLGSLVATGLIGKFRTGPLTCFCLSTLSASLVLMSLNTSLLWLGVMLFIGCFSIPALNAGIGGYFMAVIPQEMAGRASSLITFMALAAMPLAPLITGFGLQLFGMGPTLLFFGLLAAAATISAWISPQVRSIPHPDQWVTNATELTAPASASDSATENDGQQAPTPEGESDMSQAPTAQQTASSRRLPSRRTFSSDVRHHHGAFPAQENLRQSRAHELTRNEQWIYL